MKNRLLQLTLVIGLLANVIAKGADDEIISRSFIDYWKAWAAQDFERAGKQIFPEDFVAVKIEILPVFLSASQSPEKDVRDMAAAFFGKIPENKRHALSPKQVYECLNRFIKVANPESFHVLKSSSITVDRVEIAGSNATIYYRIQMHGIPENDTETFIKKDGKWWLRTKEDPKETGRKLQMLFKQKPSPKTFFPLGRHSAKLFGGMMTPIGSGFVEFTDEAGGRISLSVSGSDGQRYKAVFSRDREHCFFLDSINLNSEGKFSPSSAGPLGERIDRSWSSASGSYTVVLGFTHSDQAHFVYLRDRLTNDPLLVAKFSSLDAKD